MEYLTKGWLYAHGIRFPNNLAEERFLCIVNGECVRRTMKELGDSVFTGRNIDTYMPAWGKTPPEWEDVRRMFLGQRSKFLRAERIHKRKIRYEVLGNRDAILPNMTWLSFPCATTGQELSYLAFDLICDNDIAELSLAEFERNCLENARIEHIGELLVMDEDDLEEEPGLKSALPRIRRTVARYIEAVMQASADASPP